MNSDAIVEAAMKYEGFASMRYRNRDMGKDPSGFDCSGFVLFVLLQVGFPISQEVRHCNQFFDRFGVLVHPDLHKKGDLVFFSRNGYCPNHMGIMISNDRYIHSPGKADRRVIVSHLKMTSLVPRIRARTEQIYNKNPIGFKRPAILNGRFHKMIK